MPLRYYLCRRGLAECWEAVKRTTIPEVPTRTTTGRLYAAANKHPGISARTFVSRNERNIPRIYGTREINWEGYMEEEWKKAWKSVREKTKGTRRILPLFWVENVSCKKGENEREWGRVSYRFIQALINQRNYFYHNFYVNLSLLSMTKNVRWNKHVATYCIVFLFYCVTFMLKTWILERIEIHRIMCRKKYLQTAVLKIWVIVIVVELTFYSVSCTKVVSKSVWIRRTRDDVSSSIFWRGGFCFFFCCFHVRDSKEFERKRRNVL